MATNNRTEADARTNLQKYLRQLAYFDEKLPEIMEKMKEELEEKEFEVQRMQKEQERALVVNNAKVKLRGQYEM